MKPFGGPMTSGNYPKFSTEQYHVYGGNIATEIESVVVML